MQLRPRHEIELLIEHLIRSTWHFASLLQEDGHDREDITEMFSRISTSQLCYLFAMRLAGSRRDYDITPALMMPLIDVYQKKYNKFVHAANKINQQGLPIPLTILQIEFALNDTVQAIADTFYQTYAPYQ